MAVAELNKIDTRLTEIYADKAMTNAENAPQDRSNILFENMQMIAFNNKMFLKLK